MWFNSWGATSYERTMPIPGMVVPSNARLLSTHAITIDAPAEKIWPWLVQIGQGRGGFYSYTWLENLVGCRMRNLKRLVPDLQRLNVGDDIYLHPKAPPLKVTQMERNRLLVLDGWSLILRPLDETSTRLISRSYEWPRPERRSVWIDRLFSGVIFDFIHWFMERKMFLTIKRLAEDRVSGEKIAAHATIAWFGFLALAFANGAFRELVLKRLMGEPWAHDVSVGTAILLFSWLVFRLRGWLTIPSPRVAWLVGLYWCTLTVLTETFVIGRWMMHASWSTIFKSYDLIGGSLWPLAVAWLGVLPALFEWSGRSR